MIATPRRHFVWKLAGRELLLGERTLLMGVLNVTPDSFTDGGKYLDPDRAFARAIELEEQGADIIDIGAESTKPGSERVSEAEELRRLIPVLKRLRGKLNTPISVDTYKAEVAERALELGAEIHARSPKDAEQLCAALSMLEAMVKGSQPTAASVKFDIHTEDGTVNLAIVVPEAQVLQAIRMQAGAPAQAIAGKPVAPPVPVKEPVKATPPSMVFDQEGNTVILTLPGAKK